MIRDHISVPIGERDYPDLFDTQTDVQHKPHGLRNANPPVPRIPFRQRPTCTIKEACSAAGLGRTKLYELINGGALKTTTIGRRRLVLVSSLL